MDLKSYQGLMPQDVLGFCVAGFLLILFFLIAYAWLILPFRLVNLMKRQIQLLEEISLNLPRPVPHATRPPGY